MLSTIMTALKAQLARTLNFTENFCIAQLGQCVIYRQEDISLSLDTFIQLCEINTNTYLII